MWAPNLSADGPWSVFTIPTSCSRRHVTDSFLGEHQCHLDCVRRLEGHDLKEGHQMCVFPGEAEHVGALRNPAKHMECLVWVPDSSYVWRRWYRHGHSAAAREHHRGPPGDGVPAVSFRRVLFYSTRTRATFSSSGARSPDARAAIVGHPCGARRRGRIQAWPAGLGYERATPYVGADIVTLSVPPRVVAEYS